MTIEIVNVTINTPVVEVVNVTVNPSGVQTVTVSVDDAGTNTADIAALAVRMTTAEADIVALETLDTLMRNEKVYSGVGNASTTSSTAYVTPPLTPTNTLAFTKQRADTSLLITLSVSCYATTAGGVTFGVSIGGTDYDVLIGFQNTTGTHRGWSQTKEITGLSAGAKTMIIRWKTTGSANMDANDYLSLHVREVLR
jgi:hypothetical protein